MLIKFKKNRYHARHMPVPPQYQVPEPTTSTGPALADQCRTSLSSPKYASTAPVVNFLLGGWEVMLHPPYGPDLAPTDYY